MTADDLRPILTKYSVLGLDPEKLEWLLGRLGNDVHVITTPVGHPGSALVEGHHLHSQGEEAKYVYFVVAGAMVLHDPGDDFPQLVGVGENGSGEFNLEDPVMVSDLDKSRVFGVFRVGDHVGESEFVCKWRWLAAAFLCHSTTVVRLTHDCFRELLNSDGIRHGLECDGVLRRVAKEFDATLDRREVTFKFNAHRRKEAVSRLRNKSSAFQSMESDDVNSWLQNYLRLVPKSSRQMTGTNPPDIVSNQATAKTYFRLDREYRACRLFRAHMFSVTRGRTLRRSSKSDPQSFHYHSQLGFYLSCNSQGKRATQDLIDSKIMAQTDPPTPQANKSLKSSKSASIQGSLYRFDVDQVERVIEFYRHVILREMHSAVEDKLWKRRLMGISVWQENSDRE